MRVEFVDPEVDDIKEIVADLLVLEIQVDEFEAVSPCFVGRRFKGQIWLQGMLEHL